MSEGGTDRRGRLRRALEARPAVRESVAHVRPHLVASAVTFGAFAVVGYLLVAPEIAGSVDLCSGGVVASESVAGYFLNNMGTAFTMMGGLGVLTLVALAYNGLLLGTALRVPVVQGMAPGALAARLVPHGVVEIPGLLVAGAIGYFLAWRVLEYLLGRRDNLATHEDEVHLVQLFVLVTALVLAAAVLETYLTPAVVERVAGGTCR